MALTQSSELHPRTLSAALEMKPEHCLESMVLKELCCSFQKVLRIFCFKSIASSMRVTSYDPTYKAVWLIDFELHWVAMLETARWSIYIEPSHYLQLQSSLHWKTEWHMLSMRAFRADEPWLVLEWNPLSWSGGFWVFIFIFDIDLSKQPNPCFLVQQFAIVRKPSNYSQPSSAVDIHWSSFYACLRIYPARWVISLIINMPEHELIRFSSVVSYTRISINKVVWRYVASSLVD